ncbi:hypothetical protein G7Y89_g13236 [Cudoniella acicularis]|uniref:Uncharacterized protein n=1 Tax=Cudoniella acicularis TaxID=354080 RepID=A0A8H4R7T2_9HELO|nr:hypothetical protein G7Y89_g13236 [Cudoniella acicularis]
MCYWHVLDENGEWCWTGEVLEHLDRRIKSIEDGSCVVEGGVEDILLERVKEIEEGKKRKRGKWRIFKRVVTLSWLTPPEFERALDPRLVEVKELLQKKKEVKTKSNLEASLEKVDEYFRGYERKFVVSDCDTEDRVLKPHLDTTPPGLKAAVSNFIDFGIKPLKFHRQLLGRIKYKEFQTQEVLDHLEKKLQHLEEKNGDGKPEDLLLGEIVKREAEIEKRVNFNVVRIMAEQAFLGRFSPVGPGVNPEFEPRFWKIELLIEDWKEKKAELAGLNESKKLEDGSHEDG